MMASGGSFAAGASAVQLAAAQEPIHWLAQGFHWEDCRMNESLSDLVAATLAEMGLPVQTRMMLTMLIEDCRFAGHKLSYDRGYAIVQPGGNVLELYDNWGKLLRSVVIGVESEKGTAA
jgi:hypothetical protein